MKYYYRPILLMALLLLSTAITAQHWQNPAQRYLDAYKAYTDAECPIPRDSMQHFVYFARDRAAVRNHPLLTHAGFAGAQIMYTWRELEPRAGEYDFSTIQEDLDYLRSYGKKLFLQLQDATFQPKYKAIPPYLFSEEYDGGAAIQYNDQGDPEGWVAKRWNAKVRERFARLLTELGKAFDGQLEGINLQETSIGVDAKTDASFSETAYFAGLKDNMRALKAAFPHSTTMLYANFMPGEWLPWEDKGYLRGLYEFGNEVGVGLGAPDLMVTRKGQLNNPLAMMHEGDYQVPLGIAIQDGNYVGKTGADADYNEYQDQGKSNRNSIVPLLHGFAADFLKVDYMFWGNQAPYFVEDVLPCFGE